MTANDRSGLVSTRTLGLRSLSVLAVRVVGAGAGFLLQVVAARALGADEMGSYALALTIALVSSVIARLGMDTAVLRYASAAYSQRDGGGLAVVQRAVLLVLLPITLLAAVLGILASGSMASELFGKPELAGPLRVMFSSVPIFALASVLGESLRAADRHIAAAAVQGGAIPLISLIVVLVIGANVRTAEDLAWIYLGSCTTVLAAAAALWRRARRLDPSGEGGAEKVCVGSQLSAKMVLHTSLGMYGAAVAGVLLAWIDTIILGLWASSTEVGVYNAAARTAMLTSFVLLAVNSVAAPRFASAPLREDAQATQRLACRAALLTSGATLPVIAVLALIPDRVLGLFGPEFTSGAAAMVIIALGQMVNAATGPVGHLLNMRGLHAVETRLSVLSVAINAVACMLMVPAWGGVGAASANASAVVACNLLRVLMVRRYLGFWVYPRH